MDKEGGATKDIQQRLSKARQTFYRLRRIWDSSEISKKMEVQLFKTIVRAVLMYNCEAGLETYESRSKEAGRFPIQMHEMHTENKMATDHLTPINPGDHSSEQNK